MFPVEVRGVKIGEGIPKICVPIVGSTEQDILEQARKIQELPVEIVEWRADWFDKINSTQEIEKVINNLREVLGEKIILFTYRTVNEGGNGTFEVEKYKFLYENVLEMENVDLVDLELFQNEMIINELIRKAQKYNKKVVLSNHDFDKTPTKDELVRRLFKMQEMGADISKVAVMPKSKNDVLILMDATQEMCEKGTRNPIVAISMGELGRLSRINAEYFGSSITFGNVGESSAPGQVEAKELLHYLRMIHENIQISNK